MQVVLAARRVDLDDFSCWSQQHLRSTDAVVLEATTNAWHLCDQLGPQTHWVIETALAQCRRWLESGLHLSVAVNLSMVNLAHSLGISVVAEGVEDEATWNLLAALGCDLTQGFYLSRPVPAQDLERWLDEREKAAERWPGEMREVVAP